MKITLIVLTVIWIAVALVGTLTPWSGELLMKMMIMLIVAGVLYAIIRLVAWAILRRRGPRVVSIPAAGMLSPRPLALLLLTPVAIIVWQILCSSMGSKVVLEVGYYLIMLLSGYVLSRWGGSRSYVPVVIGILLLVIEASLGAFMFLNNPSAQFQYGVEIAFFAAGNVVSRTAMLPVDAVALWGGWIIGEAIKGSVNKNGHVIKEPASDVVSATHEG